MIFKNNQELKSLYKGSTSIDKVYKGLTLIWEAIRTITKKAVPPFTIYTVKGYISNYKIEGNSAQYTTPSLSAPSSIVSVGNKTVNLLNPDFNATKFGGYRYFGFSGEARPLVIHLRDKNTSADLTGISFGFTGAGNNSQGGFNWLVSNGRIAKTITYNTQNNKGDTVETPYMYFSVHPTDEEVWNTVFDRFYIQVEEGSTMTQYKPYGYEIPITVYHKPTKTTTSTHVYADEPLRKVGEYFDYLECKNKEIEVVRNIKYELITKVEEAISETSTYKKFSSAISNVPLIEGDTIATSKGFCISNKFQQSNVNYTEMGAVANNIQTHVTSAGLNKVIYTLDKTSITTVTQAKNAIGDGFEVCYVLANPIRKYSSEVSISLEEGENIIEVNTMINPSNMEVTYKGK